MWEHLQSFGREDAQGEFAEAGEDQNLYILIGGLFVLMIGLYRLSRGIPSRNEQSNGDTPVNEEWALK